jgi:glycosyltransferase involved in cell wall biosynthesis
MRVLHVISGIDPRGGGTTKALLGLATAQCRAGLDVRVIATWRDPDAFVSAGQLERAGVGTKMIGPAGGLFFGHADLPRALDDEICSHDVVHIHALWEDIQHEACRIAARLRVPYIVTPHGMLSQWSLSQHAIRKRIYLAWRLRRNLNAAAALHFTTAPERDSAAVQRLYPPAIIEPLGADLAEFASLPRRGLFRERHGLAETRRLIVFLGRIHAGKGLEYLVPALAELNDRDAMLAVVGPDSRGFQRGVERQVAQLGLGSRVIFTGMLTGEEKLSALVDPDLFSLPSSHENFGLSIIEALASGTPVVISDQVNIHELNESSTNTGPRSRALSTASVTCDASFSVGMRTFTVGVTAPAPPASVGRACPYAGSTGLPARGSSALSNTRTSTSSRSSGTLPARRGGRAAGRIGTGSGGSRGRAGSS